MIPTKRYISTLLSERSRYAKVFNIEESRRVYNPLIKLHINGFKKQLHTLNCYYIPKEQYTKLEKQQHIINTEKFTQMED